MDSLLSSDGYIYWLLLAVDSTDRGMGLGLNDRLKLNKPSVHFICLDQQVL